MERVQELASQKAAIIFTKSTCCMCDSIAALFHKLGANPAIHELDRDANGREMEHALRGLGCNPPVPAVFIAGKFIGSTKETMALHLDGALRKMLINAKVIWL